MTIFYDGCDSYPRTFNIANDHHLKRCFIFNAVVCKSAVSILELGDLEHEVEPSREMYSLFRTNASMVLMVSDDSTWRQSVLLPRTKICISSSSPSSSSVARMGGGGDDVEGRSARTDKSPCNAGK